MPRGRPIGSGTGTKETKNITVDAEIQDMLSDLCDELHNQFGFRPTISQALKFLMSERKKKVTR